MSEGCEGGGQEMSGGMLVPICIVWKLWYVCGWRGLNDLAIPQLCCGMYNAEG